MTTKKTSTYMSQYDKEVETRLEAIEAELASIKQALAANAQAPAATAPSSDVEAKLNTLIAVLKSNPKNNIEKLSKGTL